MLHSGRQLSLQGPVQTKDPLESALFDGPIEPTRGTGKPHCHQDGRSIFFRHGTTYLAHRNVKPSRWVSQNVSSPTWSSFCQNLHLVDSFEKRPLTLLSKPLPLAIPIFCIHRPREPMFSQKKKARRGFLTLAFMIFVFVFR